MVVQKKIHTPDDHKKDSDYPKQNFASKSKEKGKELASKGWRSQGTSHKDEDTKSASHIAHTRREDDKDNDH